MKLDKEGSKRNRRALKLTSILLSMVIVGSGLALAGCTTKEQEQETVAIVEKQLPTEEPITNYLKEIWPEYEERVNNLKEELDLPERLINDSSILFDIIQVLKEQNEPIEFIKDNNLIYTSDKKICYDTSRDNLQLSLNYGRNVLREYCSFSKENCKNSKERNTIVYDSDGNSLEFNRIDKYGLTHNYDNMPIYIFEKEHSYNENETITYKKFSHIDYSSDTYFYGSYEYKNLHYCSKKYPYDYNTLKIYFSTNSESEIEYYKNDEIFNAEFNDAFDNHSIDVLDQCIYNFYNAKTGSTEYVSKK